MYSSWAHCTRVGSPAGPRNAGLISFQLRLECHLNNLNLQLARHEATAARFIYTWLRNVSAVLVIVVLKSKIFWGRKEPDVRLRRARLIGHVTRVDWPRAHQSNWAMPRKHQNLHKHMSCITGPIERAAMPYLEDRSFRWLETAWWPSKHLVL